MELDLIRFRRLVKTHFSISIQSPAVDRLQRITATVVSFSISVHFWMDICIHYLQVGRVDAHRRASERALSFNSLYYFS